MPDFSIAQAKARFAELVQQAEAGRPVRITRRGKAVAVVLSEAEFSRLNDNPGAGGSLFEFSTRMRERAAAAGLALPAEDELQGLRDRSERPAQAL